MDKIDKVLVNDESMAYALSNCYEQDRTNFMATMDQYYKDKLTAKHDHITNEDALRHNASLPSAAPPLPGVLESAMIIEQASAVSKKPAPKKRKRDSGKLEILQSMQEGHFEPQPMESEPYSNGTISSTLPASSIMQQPVVDENLLAPPELAADQVYENTRGRDGGMWRWTRSESGEWIRTRIHEETDI